MLVSFILNTHGLFVSGCFGCYLSAGGPHCSQEDIDDGGDSKDKQAEDADESWDNWQANSVGIRTMLGMPPDSSPWTSKARLIGVPSWPRQIDCIDVAYWAWLKTVATEHVPTEPDFCVDVSQGVERKPWGPTPHMLGQGSQTYVFSLDRVLDGEDVFEQISYIERI